MYLSLCSIIPRQSAQQVSRQVRTHPVTRVKSLFYNPSYMIHIKELKAQEAAHSLSFLREHINSADDLTVRWKWEAGSVAFWDNRVVTHKAIPGGYDTAAREGKRTAVFGEKPFYDANSETLSQRSERFGGNREFLKGISSIPFGP